ncbi:Rop guanine nucleotide exchange factor 1-like protein [Tanacetum coccineum]|uniref:Rop guanine nucleotide exchange factor 1-like protein n=1 Tax=Tanacetum coccineum TaxID=301880 RepID=A0ABQ4YDJ3_9ASTR
MMYLTKQYGAVIRLIGLWKPLHIDIRNIVDYSRPHFRDEGSIFHQDTRTNTNFGRLTGGTDERAAIKSFTDENKQVMQADQDIIWLQCDFGLTVLKLERNSLESLLQYYCEVAAIKEFNILCAAGLFEDARKRLQQCRDRSHRILKPALVINSNVHTEMEIPVAYLDSLPKFFVTVDFKRLDSDTFKPIARFTCTSTDGRNVLEKECQKAGILHTGLLDKGMLEDGATDVDRVLGVIYGDIAFV